MGWTHQVVGLIKVRTTSGLCANDFTGSSGISPPSAISDGQLHAKFERRKRLPAVDQCRQCAPGEEKLSLFEVGLRLLPRLVSSRTVIPLATMPVDAAEWLAQNATSYNVPPASDGAPDDGAQARLVVVINAHSGARKAQQLWDEVTAPLLRYALPSHISFDDDVRYTKSEGDGERIGRELRQQQAMEGSGSLRRLVLLVLGGDGTVHEALNGLLVDEHGRENHPGGTIELVLV